MPTGLSSSGPDAPRFGIGDHEGVRVLAALNQFAKLDVQQYR